ncbi:MAG TPA: 50S ribosomal protein L31 [Clostridia bacterium]
MKKNIHPDYHMVTIECACGEKFISGSTVKGDTIKVEVCSKCHPFYTGKQKIAETGGRIDKFKKRFNLNG